MISNNIPCSLSKPTFYVHAIKAFQELLKINPTVDIETLTVKKVYNILLQDVLISPRVSRICPNINYTKSFKNLSISLLSSESRDLTFQIRV